MANLILWARSEKNGSAGNTAREEPVASRIQTGNGFRHDYHRQESGSNDNDLLAGQPLKSSSILAPDSWLLLDSVTGNPANGGTDLAHMTRHFDPGKPFLWKPLPQQRLLLSMVLRWQTPFVTSPTAL